ncbi:MAG TPA: PAS domain-containing protein, partial [Rhodothermales bacterium]
MEPGRLRFDTWTIGLEMEQVTGKKAYRPQEVVSEGVAQFRRLLDELPAGAYTCDADGLITYYNRQAVALWGREPRLNDPTERFTGSFRLYAPDGTLLAPDQSWMARAIREREEFSAREVVIETPDGRRRIALAHISPMFDGDGRFVGALNVLADITSQKAA